MIHFLIGKEAEGYVIGAVGESAGAGGYGCALARETGSVAPMVLDGPINGELRDG